MPNIPVRIDAHDSGSINNQSATIMPGESAESSRQKHGTTAGWLGRWRQLPTTRAILRIASVAVDGAASRGVIYIAMFFVI